MRTLLLLFISLAANGQAFYKDTAYPQDYSVKYESAIARLMKVACDRNNVIQVLSSEGLLRPQHGAFLYPGKLTPDKSYRPLLDRKITALTLYDRQFVYADTQAILSNAWAGRLYLPVPNVTLVAGGPGFSFLLSDGHSLQYFKDSLLLYQSHSKDSIIDLRWDEHAHFFWVLGQHTLSWFSPMTKECRRIYHGNDLTCMEPVDSGILVGTHNGYFLLNDTPAGAIDHRLPSADITVIRRLPCPDITVIRRINGKTWFGSTRGAFVGHSPQPGRYSATGDNHFDYFASRRWLPCDSVVDIAAGPGGQVLILTGRGLAALHFDPMTLYDKAVFFEKQVRDRHIRLGFNAMLAGMQDGDLSTGSLEDSDNDGLWTSMYLAAEAFRYAVTHDPGALQNCRESLDAMERLYTINSLKGFPSRSFERRGYAAADTQVWKHAPDPQWDWKSTTSSDEAIGHVFAFGVIADVVDDTALKQKAIRLLDGLMSHIVGHDLYLVDWNGKPTTWGRWNPAYVNARPEMVGDRKINSSNIIAMLETAWHFTGKPIYRDKAFELMNKYGYLDNLTRPMSGIGPAPPDADALSRRLSEGWNHSDDEMYFLGYWGLYRYAFNDTLRRRFKAAILDHWQAERPEKEGAWDLATAITGTPQFDLDAAVWYLQRSPLDMIDWSVTNSHRQDIVPIAPNFRRQTIAEVLPPDELPVSRHNANRFQLDGNGNGHAEYSAGDIWLLPYWLGRYLHIISAPVKTEQPPGTSDATAPPPAPVAAATLLPISKHSFVIIAHRADHEHAPENTLAAIRDAIRCGADYVELDLRTTRDGHLVLNHDASTDRMTGSHGTIAGLTLAELHRLVVRNPGAAPHGDHIPEFRDALRACKDKINIYLDFKEADVAGTWRQIRAAHMELQVVVYLNKPGQYEQWRAVAPQVPLMNSLPDDHATRQQIDSFLEKENIAVLDNVYDTLQQRYVRQRGIALWLDAQSDHESPATWSVLLRQNIQGIQTDHPEELIAWLRHHETAPVGPAITPTAVDPGKTR
ncbi:MAG TPA: glycerophosphodiester phosphodiesterase family protein [Puia sp.]|nr:glycerophosphodiester phosphodiesterase family protein [Puia sp.]